MTRVTKVTRSKEFAWLLPHWFYSNEKFLTSWRCHFHIEHDDSWPLLNFYILHFLLDTSTVIYSKWIWVDISDSSPACAGPRESRTVPQEDVQASSLCWLSTFFGTGDGDDAGGDQIRSVASHGSHSACGSWLWTSQGKVLARQQNLLVSPKRLLISSGDVRPTLYKKSQDLMD